MVGFCTLPSRVCALSESTVSSQAAQMHLVRSVAHNTMPLKLSLMHLVMSLARSTMPLKPTVMHLAMSLAHSTMPLNQLQSRQLWLCCADPGAAHHSSARCSSDPALGRQVALPDGALGAHLRPHPGNLHWPGGFQGAAGGRQGLG